MVVAALLSAIHVLTLALGLGAIVARGRALARPSDEIDWSRLLAADNAWGAAAVLWIASGVGRVLYGGKSPDFYLRNALFWLKLTLFGLVFVLETWPMATFIGARRARRQGLRPPGFPVGLYRGINAIEVALVIVIVFVAAFMARAAWMF